MNKEYLGDSVYAEIEDGMVKLTTENGGQANNVIYLDFEVYRALVDWVNKIQLKTSIDENL